MNKDEEYPSDSDQSDQDFCPDNAAIADSDAPSEEDSDDQFSDEEDVLVNDKRERGRSKKGDQLKKKSLKKNHPAESLEPTEKRQNQKEYKACRTRQDADEAGRTTKSSIEKDELDSDEEDKSRTDALWADFLSDVKPSRTPSVNEPTRAGGSRSTRTAAVAKPNVQNSDKPQIPKKIVVTEILEFAGEEIKVEKTISSDNIKENKQSQAAGGSGIAAGRKRPIAGASKGIGSVLDQLGEKTKISVLEKTKLDWDNYKHTEGIEEQLQTFNKGKDGYLERQDFLERTDMRQFEIEKNLRHAKRTNH